VLQLHPAGSGPPDLAALYAHPPGLRLNMVTSVDGAAVVDGGSKVLSGPEDRSVFHLLRAQADVVLVGAGTARSERYRAPALPAETVEQRLARGQSPLLRVAVISNGSGLPAGHPLLESAEVLLLLTTTAGAAAAPEGVDTVVVGDDRVDVRRAVAALAERGLSRVLCEGGPTLNAALLDADLVDEVCHTTAGLAVGGSAPRMVAGGAEHRRKLVLAHLLLGDAVLLARWTR
jgi:riboflavin biosynthesis pyrimidine reductase